MILRSISISTRPRKICNAHIGASAVKLYDSYLGSNNMFCGGCGGGGDEKLILPLRETQKQLLIDRSIALCSLLR